jgi:hypothetical protein
VSATSGDDASSVDQISVHPVYCAGAVSLRLLRPWPAAVSRREHGRLSDHASAHSNTRVRGTTWQRSTKLLSLL